METSASSPCPSDDRLVAWIEDRLTREDKAELSAHFEECSACWELLTQFAHTWPQEMGLATRSEGARLVVPAAEPEPGYRLGAGKLVDRYVILHAVGSGGMGEVYAAYDAKLDRKVALKLLRRDTDSVARARLLSEARAMAKLAHPNVITVYEAGTAAGEDFVAMEFVDGTPVNRYLRKDRSIGEILSLFRQAGRGLAAAHDARLIHRDFKPANVLRGKDGRVRVTDFGLARPVGAGAQQGQWPRALPTRESLTRSGAIVGTPAYMAPEQIEGRAVSAQSDQFSFCVALYEALYGERPFRGDTLHEMHACTRRGEIDAPSSSSRVPGWIRRVLWRGLRAAPEERYPSMNALLGELEKDPVRQRRRRLWRVGLAAGMVSLLGLAALAFMGGDAEVSPCQSAQKELVDVWDEKIEKAIGAAFAATGRPYAADTFARVKRRLNHHAGSWVAMRTDACEATHLHHAQSGELLDLRMRCLDRRRGELGALTTLLATQADGEIVDHAVEAVAKLRSLRPCADAETLRAAYPPPEDRATREKAKQLRARLDEADALDKAGKYRQGLEMTRGVTAQIQALRYPPLQAEERFLRGRFLQRTGDAKGAEPILYESGRYAAESRDATAVAMAWLELIWVVGYQLARYDEAMILYPLAETAIVLAGDDELLRAKLWGRLGAVLWSQGKYEESRRHHELALAIRESALGADHLDVAMNLNNLGLDLWSLGRYAQAQHHHERALAIKEKKLGANHPDVAITLNNLGLVLMDLGKHVEAGKHYTRALSIREEALGLDHPDVAATLNNLGIVLKTNGDHQGAQQLFERALAINEAALGPNHPDVAYALNNVGEVLFAQAAYDEARSYLERALEVRERALGLTNPHLAFSLTTLGQIALAQSQPLAALAPLERALAIRVAANLRGVELAETQFALARALWDSQRDRTRAIGLAGQSRDIYASTGDGREKLLAEVERWLARPTRTAPPP